MQKRQIKTYKIRFLACGLFLFFFTGCSSIEYLWHVSVEQVDLLNDRVPIESALEEYEFTKEEKKKLQLVSEVKTFSIEKTEDGHRRGCVFHLCAVTSSPM